MGIFFERYQSDRCCLCGSHEALTGEHKIKASALRAIFREDAMFIGQFDSVSKPRLAQGPKSHAFHFGVRICASCNGARTQEPDREFDRFHAHVTAKLAKGEDPGLAFDLPRYTKESRPYLNLFRYFAKLLCCHIAESGGPRALALSTFAISTVDQNPVFLSIDTDPTFADYATLTEGHEYAAHGGLVVTFSAKSESSTGFRSSLTLGPVRYIFWVSYGRTVGLAIRLFHRNFWARCETAYREARENPLPNEQRQRLGL